ncbi:MAG: Txe/YoeB family addiction module toxin [Angustibacter sp.]
MRLSFTPSAWADYCHWQHHDRALLKRINRLLEETLRSPTTGIGKPEQLKYGVDRSWSRRITEEHRLVYQILDEELVILQLRYHYGRF